MSHIWVRSTFDLYLDRISISCKYVSTVMYRTLSPTLGLTKAHLHYYVCILLCICILHRLFYIIYTIHLGI